MVLQEQPSWECLVDAGNQIGEAPIWSGDEGSLYWIDAESTPSKLTRLAVASTATRSWSFPDRIGTYCLTTSPSLVVAALRSGIYELDLETDELRMIHAAPYNRELFQFNDGRCDRDGNFWVGTMALDIEGTQGADSLWRLGQDGLTKRVDGVTLTNGIAFSSSGDTMYLADFPSASILAFDHHRGEGTIANRRTFAHLDDGEFPDGAAVDAEGCYWVAVMGAGRVLRFRPDGTLDRDLRVPVSHPTMVCFGGPDHRQMFVTSGRYLIDQLGAPDEPQAGGVFVCDVGAQGIPEPRFKFGTR